MLPEELSMKDLMVSEASVVSRLIINDLSVCLSVELIFYGLRDFCDFNNSPKTLSVLLLLCLLIKDFKFELYKDLFLERLLEFLSFDSSFIIDFRLLD